LALLAKTLNAPAFTRTALCIRTAVTGRTALFSRTIGVSAIRRNWTIRTITGRAFRIARRSITQLRRGQRRPLLRPRSIGRRRRRLRWAFLLGE
jgi:hypothetical protein